MRYMRVGRLLLGLFLVCAGLVGDWAVLASVVRGASPYFLLLHIPAVFAWALGINLLLKQNSYRVLAVRSRRIHIQGLGVAGLFFALCTFPGLGPLVYSVALLFANCMPRRSMADMQDEPVPLPEKAAQLDQDVLPLIDVVFDADAGADTKRAAVSILSRERNPGAMALLRQLLRDPAPEVRRDASVVLTQLQDELFRELRASFMQWTDDPADREHIIGLADQYVSFAQSNILDEASQTIYLTKARDLLQQVAAEEGADAILLVKLARIRQSLGELSEALQDVRGALQREPASHEAFELAMDIAFREHSWDEFFTLARDALAVLPADSGTHTALREWVALQPDLVGVSHG